MDGGLEGDAVHGHLSEHRSKQHRGDAAGDGRAPAIPGRRAPAGRSSPASHDQEPTTLPPHERPPRCRWAGNQRGAGDPSPPRAPVRAHRLRPRHAAPSGSIPGLKGRGRRAAVDERRTTQGHRQGPDRVVIDVLPRRSDIRAGARGARMCLVSVASEDPVGRREQPPPWLRIARRGAPPDGQDGGVAASRRRGDVVPADGGPGAASACC